MTPRERAFRRVALAGQAACVTSVALYAVCRAIQAAWLEAPMTATRAASVAGGHAGYFWRAWTVSYAGVMVGFLAFAAARAHEAKVARALLVTLSVAVVLIVAQGVFVP